MFAFIRHPLIKLLANGETILMNAQFNYPTDAVVHLDKNPRGAYVESCNFSGNGKCAPVRWGDEYPPID